MNDSPEGQHRDRAATAMFLLLSVLMLAHAIQLGNGTIYNSPDQTEPLNSSLGWMSAALICCALGVLLPRIELLERLASRNILVVGIIGLTWQFYSQLITSPGSFVEVNVFRSIHIFILLMTIILAGTLAGFTSRWRKPAMLLVVGSFIMIGLWLCRVSPNPYIDVHVFQHDSTLALLHGKNPYSITFRNIYAGAIDGDKRYGQGIVNNGRLNFGYPYWPLTLLITTAAQAIYNDYRLAQLLSLAAAGTLMMLLRRSALSLLIAAIFLTSPRIFFVLELGWVDPVSIALFAAVIYAAARSSKLLDLVVGLFLVSKQYIIIALPLTWLLRNSRTQRVRMTIISLAVVAIFILPFLILAPHNFVSSSIITQFRQPFRDDALSYLAWFYQRKHVMLPSLFGFLAAGVACLIAWCTVPRTAAGVASAIALEFFAFFAFNKQAFANYYMLVIGMMCCAIAATLFDAHEVPNEQSPRSA